MNEISVNQLFIEKIRNDLSNESRNVRRNCLHELHKKIDSISSSKLDSLNKSYILKSLIKVFVDQVEGCREAAVNLVISCVREWNLTEDEILFHLVPTIHRRVVTDLEIESSEEVRLCYFKLMREVIRKYHSIIESHLKEITDILIFGIGDQYPEIKKEGCECASQLAEKMPKFRLHSDEIINAMLKALKHKHFKVRITAINSLKNIVQFGRPGSIELVYVSLGECLMDQNSHVRLSVLRVAAFWFMKLPDRYSYFRYLLPLVLTELADETLVIGDEASSLWHQIGLQYVQENEESLEEQLECLPAELEYYPAYAKRPNLGCRTLVQNEMMKIIPTLIHELEDWKTEVRIKSSELLKIIVLHAELRIVSFIDTLIPIMCKACVDNDCTVCKNVIKAAEIMGYFLTPDMYWFLIIPRMQENHTSGQYMILASFLRYSQKIAVTEKMNQFVHELASNDICDAKDKLSQRYLLKITSKLLDCGIDMNLEKDVVYGLYSILVTQMALGDEEIQNESETQITKLAEVCCSSVSKLNQKCVPKIFERLSASSIIWESYSLDLRIFIILLSKYSDDVFEVVPSLVLCILRQRLEDKREREVTFKLLCTLAKLLENKRFNFQKYIGIVESIILGPVKEHLIWTAGKVVEVVRCAALSFVLLYLENSPQVPSEFLPEVFPLLLSSCEDGYEETRSYSLQTLPYIGKSENGKIESAIFIKSFCVAAERLNDKSKVVRVKASKILKELLLKAPDLSTYKDGADFQRMSTALKLIFINADDDDNQIRETIFDIVEDASITENIKSILSQNEINSLIRKCRNDNVSNLLKQYLNL